MLTWIMLATGMMHRSQVQMSSNLEYDIELGELRTDTDDVGRDNTQTVEVTLLKIQEILRDIERRLGELE